MLLPVYAASYLDDQGQPQSIFIHGQTGQIAGTRRSSMQRAVRVAVRLAGAVPSGRPRLARQPVSRLDLAHDLVRLGDEPVSACGGVDDTPE